jgi:hypothetical protein
MQTAHSRSPGCDACRMPQCGSPSNMVSHWQLLTCCISHWHMPFYLPPSCCPSALLAAVHTSRQQQGGAVRVSTGGLYYKFVHLPGHCL